MNEGRARQASCSDSMEFNEKKHLVEYQSAVFHESHVPIVSWSFLKFRRT